MTKPRIAEPIKKMAFKHFRDDISEDTFHEQMEAMGWTELGSGQYAWVYGNPNKSYVLKVSKQYDSGYENYVRVIKRNPNAHFPRIGDVKKLRIGRDNYYVHLIEKLKELPINRGDFVAEQIDLAVDDVYNLTRQQAVKFFNKPPHILPKFIAMDSTMQDAIFILAKNGEFFDIAGNNVMQRKDGTIVITDPYS